MKAEVVCVASAKGGSGKTVLTASLASFLNGIGKKCLIIDCDAATHGMTLLYLSAVTKNRSDFKRGLFEIPNTNISEIEMENILMDSIIKIENSIDILPATYNFTPGFDPEEFFEDNSFSRIISILRFNYDYIFLDAQAGSDKYSKLAMNKNISDKVVIVSEYDPLSAAGIERLKQVIGSDLDYTRTWILLNKMLPEFVDKFSEFLSITQYLPPIPWNADIVRAYAKRKLALDLENGNAFTLAIMRTLKELFGEEIEKDINKWKEERTYALREPLEAQYFNSEKELEYLFKSRNELRIKYKRKLILILYGIILSLAGVFISINNIEPGIFRSILDTLSELKSSTIFVVSGVLIYAVIQAFIVIIERRLTFKDDVEKAKFDRQIQIVEEKLRQLEAMRVADFESIVKKKTKGSGTK